MLVAGFQPSGDGRLHVGNYFGSVKPLIQAVESSGNAAPYQVIIADIHATTTQHSPAVYAASGVCAKEVSLCLKTLRPQSDHAIHRQGAILEHYELGLIMQHLAHMGDLERMTQFRSKSEGRSSVDVSLFTYPTLMAADIALMRASQVMAGRDQTQHINLARHLIKRFTKCYGHALRDFKPLNDPEVLSRNTTIMSLTAPDRKMSKSDPKGALYLSDSVDVVAKKINAAVTGSNRHISSEIAENEIGTRALLSLLANYRNQSVVECADYMAGYGMAELKDHIIEEHLDLFADIRNLKDAERTPDADDFLEAGNDRARLIAAETMRDVRARMRGM